MDADDEKPDRNKDKFESGFDTRATYKDQADDAQARVRQSTLRESRILDAPKPSIAASSYIPINLIERQIATKLSLLYPDERKRYDQHVKAAVERYGDATPQYRLDVAKTLLQPVPEQQQERQIAGHLRSEYSRQQKQNQHAFDAEQRALQASAHQQRAELAKRRSANQNLPFKLQPWQQQATAIKERLQRMLGRYAPLKAYAASPKRKRLPTRKKSSQVQSKSVSKGKKGELAIPAHLREAKGKKTAAQEAAKGGRKLTDAKQDNPFERLHRRDMENKQSARQEAAKGGRKLTDAEKANAPANAARPSSRARSRNDSFVIAAMKESRTQGRGGGRGGR